MRSGPTLRFPRQAFVTGETQEPLDGLDIQFAPGLVEQLLHSATVPARQGSPDPADRPPAELPLPDRGRADPGREVA